MEGTASLRKAAPHWSLAGDKQLLEVLQTLQQKIVSKCEEANSKISEMIASLDDADISQQNVNNKFMALSNSQFIESRVYDDDDVTTQPALPKEPPKPVDTESELSQLMRSLKVLEDMHEPVTILADSDSDTNTDDEDDVRVVLKPKDVYADRPLPYIIGSQQWKNKWHAGLIVEDSDTDSSVSGGDEKQEQYSESEHEIDSRTDGSHLPVREECPSSGQASPAPPSGPPAATPTAPSAVAAELARRLGGQPPVMPQQEVEYSPPKPTTRKIYRAGQPTTGTIFSDEPPPLDQCESESSQDEDDIFSELHKKQPYAHSNRDQGKLADELFGDLTANTVSGLFDDDDQTDSNTDVNGHKTLNAQTPSETDDKRNALFPNQSQPTQRTQPDDTQDERGVKKPVGGISLFGTNKGTESIGAAILKRNRKASTSEDDSGTDSKEDTLVIKNMPKITKPDDDSPKRDIFDDLFARSEKAQKKTEKKVPEEKKEKKVDLFSDNLFDDIDDIFTSSVSKVTIKEPVKTKEQKSIFDDDDELFADISITKPVKSDPKTIKTNKSIFDSDDDLFNENILTDKLTTSSSEPSVSKKDIKTEKPVRATEAKPKNLFDDDNDDDIFSNLSVTKSPIHEKPARNSFANVKHDSEKNISKIGKSTDKHTVLMPTEEQTKTNKDISQTSNLETSKQTKLEQSVTKVDSTPINLFNVDNDDIFSKVNKLPIKETTSTNQPRDLEDQIISRPNLDTNEEITRSEHEDPIKTKIQKSIFEDDDDELLSNEESFTSSVFSDKTNEKSDLFSKPRQSEATFEASIKSPSIFDEDDDLFADVTKNKNNFFEEIRTTKVISVHEKPIITSVNKINEDNNLPSDISIDVNVRKNSDLTTLEDIAHKTPGSKALEDVSNNKIEAEGLTSHSIAKTTKDVERNDSETNILENSEVEHEQPKQIHSEIPPSLETHDVKNISKIKSTHSIKIPDDIQNVNTDENTNIEVTEKASSSDIFADIFSDQPPIFEKPKEPKKSKNVNALFDDDSDDEALFFRKSDVVLDEKPDIFSPENNRFGIFQDEPPAIDVDFVQKPTKSGTFDVDGDDLFIANVKPNRNCNIEPKKPVQRPKSENLLFESVPKHINENDTVDIKLPETKDEDLFFTVKDTENDISSINKDSKPKNADVITESQAIDDTDSEQSTTETKKPVGKLKPVNFSINVNTLLPGASPKKQKPIEQTDGQTSKSNEELNVNISKIENIQPNMVKSVSFEGDPDSAILDNKLSKDRAKIKVKRRPSTRKARREAVRKSGIDFGDDSTDNSLADDPTKPEIDNLEKSKANVVSKTVYILNDEDIFNTNENENAETFDKTKSHSNPKLLIHDKLGTNTKTKELDKHKPVLNIIDDDDDLFKNIPTRSLEGITTLGKVYNEVKNDEPPKDIKESDDSKTKSIFDDLSDEELFNKNKKSVSKKTSLFESDSEEDLFKGSKSKEKIAVVREVKGSLFDDDNEDLFGVKVKTDTIKRTTKPSTKDVTAKAAEPVFEDPLSMLGDDE